MLVAGLPVQIPVMPYRTHTPVISKIANLTELQDSTLRVRATRAHCTRSLEFIALVHGEEAGLLSYEDWSDKESAFIYEIFVLPPYRRQGLGTALLLHAEQQAAQLNCKSVRLKPHALDIEPNGAHLKSWYVRQGYQEVADDPEHMEKFLRKQGESIASLKR